MGLPPTSLHNLTALIAPATLHQSFRNSCLELRTTAREFCEVMLHELLFALLGYTGDLIIDERERQQSLRVNLSPDAPLADEPTFKLAPDLEFIEPSDRYLLFRCIKFFPVNYFNPFNF